ncbi:CocE/NonD family hydrolase [Chitinivorax sp. PXF-14]|uniref:CocE/NonD family hydrolase n=1 Tax=Chitinivorax sp. PXF-14 TaxID=3230488 RepID=UPI003466246E
MKPKHYVLAAAGLFACASLAHAGVNCQPTAAGEPYLSYLTSPGKVSPYDGTCWINNLTLTSWDGTKLTANLFLPKRTSATQKFPTVVMVSSWAAADFFEYIGQSYRLAKDGYVVLSYTARGFYLSGGQVEVAGPQDIRDVSSSLDWLAANTPADMNNLAVSGISYGSGIALMALAQEPRVKTAVALSTWGNLEDQLYTADTPNKTWSDVLFYSGKFTGRLNPIVQEYIKALQDPNTSQAKIDEIKAWAKIRSPLQYVPMINARNAPAFISKNFQDDMFIPNSSMEMFRQLTGPKKLLVNQGIHASAELPGALLGADNYIYDQAHRWLDYWLKGQQNGIVSEPKVSMEVKFSGVRDQFDTLPASNIDNRQYYVGPRGDIRWDWGCVCWKGGAGDLLTAPNSATYQDWIDNSLDTTATSGLIPILSTTFESLGVPVLNWLPSVLRGQGVRYEGPALGSTLKLRGIPKLNLRVKPSQPQAQVVAYLYDLDAQGWGTLITHGVRTLHAATPGQVVDFPLEFSATAYDVPAGHRVAVVLDTRDSLYSAPSNGYLDTRFVFGSDKQSTLVLPAMR